MGQRLESKYAQQVKGARMLHMVGLHALNVLWIVTDNVSQRDDPAVNMYHEWLVWMYPKS